MTIRVSAIHNGNFVSKNNKTERNVNFTHNYYKAVKIEHELSQKGIMADFAGNEFIAESSKRIVDIFESLFGHSSLPKYIKYKPLEPGTLGSYFPGSRTVAFNSNMNIVDNDSIQAYHQKYHKYIFPNEFASYHPASTFAHEFGHSAHHQHLNEIYDSGVKVMDDLSEARISTTLGKIMTALGISLYALDKSGGLCEFMAEKITKDVCDVLTNDSWRLKQNIDVNYSNIFDRNWKGFKFASPQSFLDYVSQQVWNGKVIKENVPFSNKQITLLQDPELSVPGKIHEEMIHATLGPVDTAIRMVDSLLSKIFK